MHLDRVGLEALYVVPDELCFPGARLDYGPTACGAEFGNYSAVGVNAVMSRAWSTNAPESETGVTEPTVRVALTRDTYAYENGPTGMNHLMSLSCVETVTFTYTSNGELATKCQAGVTWTYAYNGMGLEVKKGSTVRATHAYERDQAGSIMKYLYANGMRIAKITSSGGVHYFLSDHLGSTRKILDSARVEQYSVQYEPFGKPYSTSGPRPDVRKYTMEKHDDPTGLVYLRARQYDSEITGSALSAERPRRSHR